ncbi:MAG: NADPH:quinone oxidoreductase family protein [Acidimicrobiales bacterium]
MRAWRVHELGDPVDVCRLDDIDPPSPGPGEVVVGVAACALNFPDILMCQGRYQEKPPLPFVPGLETAGTITAVGAGVDDRHVGQRVIALPAPGDGGLTEQMVAKAEATFPIPDSMDDATAAALHIVYQTSWFGLHRRAAIAPGEWLLVHAAAGGVGSSAVQLGLAAGARVIATAGGPAKVEVCRQLGAEVVIDYTADDFVEIVKDVTGGHGADVIYDPVGGDIFDRSLKVIAWEGRLLVIGFAGGRIPQAPANRILLKNCSVVGLHWGHYARHDPGLVVACHEELVRLHAAGAISPLVSAELPFADAVKGLVMLGGRDTIGKVVVRPGR